MIDILFLQIPDIHTYVFSSENRERMRKLKMCPLGLMYLASACRQQGYVPDIVDLNKYFSRQERKEVLQTYLPEKKPKVIGISCYTADYNEAKYIMRLCKKLCPDTPILFGGPHATFTPEESLMENPIEVVMRFEGEKSIVEVLDFYIKKKGNLADIKSIAYMEADRYVQTKRRELINNLDLIPFPARDLISLEHYISPGTVLTSRGCIGRCIFCTAAAMSGGNHRVRSVNNILEELNMLYYEYGIKHFNFVDDTFTVYKERNMEICKGIRNIGHGDVTFDCESRVDCVDEELLKEMRKSGCIGIQFGVESGDQFILKTIRKGIDLEQVRKAVTSAKRVGYPHIFCGFMIGHPEDTYQSIENTIIFMKELKQLGADIGCSIATPFPGTYLYNNLEKLGCKLVTREWGNYSLDQCIFETQNLSAKDVKKLHFKAGEMVNAI